jgi:hypothetical protein
LKKILIVLMVVLGMVAGMSACSISDKDVADPSFKTLRYAGGFGEGSHFKECLSEGQKLASDDTYYRYPTTQREDVFDTDNFVDKNHDGISEGSADHPDLVITVGGVDLNVKAKVQFFLNTSCEPVKVSGKEYPGGVIQYFHEHIGKTRRAYFNKDGSYNDGWLWVMDNYISTSVKELMTPALRAYTPEDAWLKNGVWEDVSAKVQENLQAAVDSAMESDLQFYKDMKVKVFGVDPEGDFKNLYKERQAAATAAQTAELNKKAKIAEAEANAAVAQSEAKVRRAEISGYGDPQTYRCVYLADKGLNCAQPQYIVGGTGPTQ